MTLNQSSSPFYEQALGCLRQALGFNADFRSGQFEAINAVMNNACTLLVEKPGWGKSSIYLICSKLLRESDRRGYTVVVSHVSWLADSQIEVARQFGLVADNLNQYIKSKEGRNNVLNKLDSGFVDVLFTTQDALHKLIESGVMLNINLLVFDEAHCMSDWGHNFKLDYRVLAETVINRGICRRILATTATANNMVLSDINGLFGNALYIQRGSLQRECVFPEVLNFANEEQKLGWLLDNLYNLTRQGVGIIYCNSAFQTKQIARMLQGYGFSALELSYDIDDQTQIETKNKFLHNEVQILVTYSKLTSNFDKPNIAFVIHFNSPSNIFNYYQQIGRAGRMWEDNNRENKARVIIMTSSSHQESEESLADPSLPAQEKFDAVVNALKTHGSLRLTDIEGCVNISRGEIKAILQQLILQKVVTLDKSQYSYNFKPWTYDQNHFEQLKQKLRDEQQAVRNLLTTHDCLTAATLKPLDFNLEQHCGHCANCRPEFKLNNLVSDRAMFAVNSFLTTPDAQCYQLKPRVTWPNAKKIDNNHTVNGTLCFSEINTVGLGQAISEQIKSGMAFSPVIQDFVCDFIRRNLSGYSHIAYIPSQRHTHVENLARYVASRCNLNLLSCFIKGAGSEQKTMCNSTWLLNNAQNSYQLNPNFAQGGFMPEKVILLDYLYNSGWTITYCGSMLRELGCKEVQPLVLTRQASDKA